MTDSTADFLTRIRNAYLAHHRRVFAPYSQTNHSIAQVLFDHQYLEKIDIKGQKPQEKQLVIHLKYTQKKPAITHLKRLSKPGLRLYASKDQLPHPLSGQGLSIISTSKGILSHHQAKKLGLGGELICEVW